MPLLRGSVALTSRLAPGDVSDADPLELRWIDPGRELRDCLPPSPERPRLGRVVGGDWDRTDARFGDRPIPRAIRRHYRDGVSWEETALPSSVEAQVTRFGDAWGHVEDAVAARIRTIESLYEAIRTDGYRTQAELAHGRTDSPGPPPLPVLGEVIVDVGRDGRVCWRRNGQHRLAISRVLDVEAVPALVARRHRTWQSIRTTAAGDGLDAIPAHLRDHPDLRDIAE